LFAIELPPGRPLSVAPTIATAEVAQHSLRIALVEDHNALREALAFSLQDAGHEVTAAASGADLRARLGEAAPDVLLTDYRLPRGETGLDVINEMRTRHHELPVILLTGDTDPRLVREMAECGVALLHKPVNLQTLLSCLDRLDLMSGVSRRNHLPTAPA
jgi:hypothetical protein